MLTPEQEAEYKQGLKAEALLTADLFNDLVQDFNQSCAESFFSVPKEKDDMEDLLRVRQTYLGFKAFQDHLFDLKTRKDDLAALMEQQLADGDTIHDNS